MSTLTPEWAFAPMAIRSPPLPLAIAASCTTDTQVATAVAPLQREELIAQVQGFTALGDTPIGLALQRASTDIPAGSTGTIVLFSDGRDECFDADLDGDPASGPSYGQDPCEIAKTITGGDAAVDRVVTVGFRAGSTAETELRCIADSTGGTYTAIETPEDARDALPQLLVQLSAPREAQRLIGRQIQGATSTEDAPDFVRLDELGADKVLYTDSIDMDSVRIYRMPEYGPDGGTFTATVFGLPPELGIVLDMRIFVPQLDQRFFQGQFGDINAGLPERPTASIRCTDCQITGGPHEAFFVVTLDFEGTGLEGTYELEILTEGPGFGGTTTSCSAPQECFYPQEIINLTEQLESSRSELNFDVGELASPALIAERDQLRVVTSSEQDAVDAANARAQELEDRIPLAPATSNSFQIPLLMILAGLGLAAAPMPKFRRAAKDDKEDGDTTGDNSTQQSGRKKKVKDVEPVRSPVSTPADAQVTVERTGPTLDDVGPAPAVSQNLKSEGNSWDIELEAAKAALAEQLPERASAPDAAEPMVAGEPLPTPATASEPLAASDQPGGIGFTAAQRAAARAAAEKAAAQRAADQAAAQTPLAKAPAFALGPATTEVSANESAAQPAVIEAPAPERVAAPETAKDPIAAAEERAAADKAAQEAAALASTRRAAADNAVIEAAQQAAKTAAEQAQTQQAAAEVAARKAVEKAAVAELAARDAAKRADAEQAARQVAERLAAAAKAPAE